MSLPAENSSTFLVIYYFFVMSFLYSAVVLDTKLFFRLFWICGSFTDDREPVIFKENKKESFCDHHSGSRVATFSVHFFSPYLLWKSLDRKNAAEIFQSLYFLEER